MNLRFGENEMLMSQQENIGSGQMRISKIEPSGKTYERHHRRLIETNGGRQPEKKS